MTDWKSLGYNTAADYARAAMIPLNPRATDEKTIAERKWLAPIKPAKPQQPCDIGLFSDDMDQVEMFMDPTNE